VAEIRLPLETWGDYRVDRHTGHLVRLLASKKLRTEKA
jgi:hypothetical protein